MQVYRAFRDTNLILKRETVRKKKILVNVNGTYWGLYTAVEQVDKTFAQSRFGNDEDGNLFKAAASDDLSGPNSDFGSDLTWLGSDPAPYHDHYQLKTNEEEDDYSVYITIFIVTILVLMGIFLGVRMRSASQSGG